MPGGIFLTTCTKAAHEHTMPPVANKRSLCPSFSILGLYQPILSFLLITGAMTLAEPHDFEVIDAPGEDNDTREAITPPQEGANESRSIRDLFKNDPGPDLAQRQAKFVIFATLPFLIASNALLAVVTIARLPNPDVRASMEDAVLLQASKDTQACLDRCRQRLAWVDEGLPSALER